MNPLKGRGSQINTVNKYCSHELSITDKDGVDEAFHLSSPATQVFYETPKKIISTNTSPDIGFSTSINPYQGCEHGCLYCYARTTHEYWGWSAGTDFETKIIVKREAPRMLEEELLKPTWKPQVIMLSGITDCYQPLEKKMKLTRGILEVMLKYRNPVGIITKNALVVRDLDILQELAKFNLVRVIFSITTQDEYLRRLLEPRTASAKKKFEAMKKLSASGVPIHVMNAPIIPSINDYEMSEIVKLSAAHGAESVNYTVVRLNGEIASIFKDWIYRHFPDRACKVLNQIKELHNGQLEDRRFGKRMSGEGEYARVIRNLFQVSIKKYLPNRKRTILETCHFRRSGQYSLF